VGANAVLGLRTTDPDGIVIANNRFVANFDIIAFARGEISTGPID